MWEELSAELTNKMRWAIGTSCNSSGINLSYSEQREVAIVLAGDVLVALKQKDESPQWALTRKSYRRLLKGGGGQKTTPLPPPEEVERQLNGAKERARLTK